MNLITLLLGNPRHHIGKLNEFAYLLFEAFMRAYVDACMKLLYPSCFVRPFFSNSLADVNMKTQHSTFDFKGHVIL